MCSHSGGKSNLVDCSTRLTEWRTYLLLQKNLVKWLGEHFKSSGRFDQVWYWEEIRWACQILVRICWKMGWIFFLVLFEGFFHITIDLLYIVVCSVQTKKLINTNVRISVLLGQKRPVWFIWFQIKVYLALWSVLIDTEGLDLEFILS